ncbi:MAG: NADH-quinone oxidoreductase subunit E [Selenomonas sp.]|nr:NADH-quinone oxidoreductase subunit E [Selenomonas sp.]
MELIFIALGMYALGTCALLLPVRGELLAHRAGTLLAAGASFLVFLAAADYLLGWGQFSLPQAWLIPFAALGQFSLAADLWSGFFLALTGLSGTAVSIYALGYAAHYKGQRLGLLTGLWNLFILSMVLVLIAGDGFTFLVAWEVMALASFLLVYHENEKKATVQAAYQYMVMTHLGTAAIMASFYLLGSASESLTFADLAKNGLTENLRHVAFALAFLGFALKSGLMPLHVWLPNAHPAAPSHVSALMSGVMLKVAVYGFGRFVFQFLGAEVFSYGLVVMLVGLVSAFLGVLYATMEKDIKRILAYSSVENMGIIFTAFGAGMLLYSLGQTMLSLVAFGAVLVHSFSHSLMKSLLFMSAGAVMHATGTKNIEQLGALLKKMPWTGAFTLVGCMALSSLPFTSGILGEWLTLQSLMSLADSAGNQGLRLLVLLAFILMGLTGALALGCFVRYFGVAFLGRRRSGAVLNAHEASNSMKIGMGIEAALIVFIGLFPGELITVAMRTLGTDFGSLRGGLWGVFWLRNMSDLAVYSPVLLLILAIILLALLALPLMGEKVFAQREITWNCGTLPTRRQQYTATGLSKPLRRAFTSILRPRRERIFLTKEHAYFGRRLEYRLSLPEHFERLLYQPAEHLLVRLADGLRVVQQGSVRLYIGYTMLAMVLVLIWGWAE